MHFFLVPCRILVLKMCKCDKDDNDYLKQELRIEIETYLHLPEWFEHCKRRNISCLMYRYRSFDQISTFSPEARNTNSGLYLGPSISSTSSWAINSSVSDGTFRFIPGRCLAISTCLRSAVQLHWKQSITNSAQTKFKIPLFQKKYFSFFPWIIPFLVH